MGRDAKFGRVCCWDPIPFSRAHMPFARQSCHLKTTMWTRHNQVRVWVKAKSDGLDSAPPNGGIAFFLSNYRLTLLLSLALDNH